MAKVGGEVCGFSRAWCGSCGQRKRWALPGFLNSKICTNTGRRLLWARCPNERWWNAAWHGDILAPTEGEDDA